MHTLAHWCRPAWTGGVAPGLARNGTKGRIQTNRLFRLISSDLYNPTYTLYSLSTAIGPRKYRIPSDLRSQAGYRLVSTTVGDHVGILGAVVFAFMVVMDGLGELQSDLVTEASAQDLMDWGTFCPTCPVVPSPANRCTQKDLLPVQSTP